MSENAQIKIGSLQAETTIDLVGVGPQQPKDGVSRMYFDAGANKLKTSNNGGPFIQTAKNPTIGTYSVSNWSAITAPVKVWESVCWSAELGLFAAVSSDGISATQVMISSDGFNWTTVDASLTSSWVSVCWASGLGKFVAVDLGTPHVIYSSNGSTWASSNNTATNTWTSVCWSEELHLLVSVAKTASARTMSSSDAIHWTSHTSADDSSSWESVCWSPELGLFAAIASSGTNRVMTSTDGNSWTAQTAAEQNSWQSICWSSEYNMFVAVASDGTNRVMTSVDGVNWVSQTAATANEWRSICWAPELNLFVAVSLDGAMMVSSNGINWTSKTIPEANQWSSICWSPELKLLVGVAKDGTHQVMASQRFNDVGIGGTGVQGNDGPAGVQGNDGVAGADGSNGSDGTPGLQGNDGATGVQGFMGDVGVQGVDGATGFQGTTGATGSTGVQGFTGSAGVQGTTGSTGSAGVQGVDGATGAAGVQGFTGSAGSTGVQGLSGPQGFAGAQGASNGFSFSYQWSTATTGSPAAGFIQANSATFTSITQLKINVTDSTSTSIQSFLTALNTSTGILLEGPSGTYALYTYSFSGGVSSGVMTLFVNHIANNSGIFPNNTNINLNIAPAGSAGSSGATGSSGNVGGFSVLYTYQAGGSPTTTGTIAFNDDSDPTLVTDVYVNTADWNSIDFTTVLAGIKAGDLLRIFDVSLSNPENFIATIVSSTYDSPNGQYHFVVSGAFGNSLIFSGEQIALSWESSGTVGFQGVQGPAGSAGTAAQQRNTLSVAPRAQSGAFCTSQYFIRYTPASDGWNDVCWAPQLGLLVAVGGANGGVNTTHVMTSNDGNYWTTQTASESNYWKSICWSPELSLFVAVAETGTHRVMTSPDGVTWTNRTAAEANSWEAVCWSPTLSLFVAVSFDGTHKVMTSPDGSTWTSQTAAGNGWQAVCWAAELGLFVAVGTSAGGTNHVMTSPDGSTWTGYAASSGSWSSIVWAPEISLLVAVDAGSGGNAMTSPDGSTWTTHSMPAKVYGDVAWSPDLGYFVACVQNGNSLSTSPDGTTWTSITNVPTACEGTGIVWSAELGMFVAVGSTQYVTLSKRILPDDIHQISVTIGDGVNNLSTSNKVVGVRVPVNMTIVDMTVIADASSTLAIHLDRASYSNYPSTSTIHTFTLSGVQKFQEAQTNFANDTLYLNQDDILDFKINTWTSGKQVTVNLTCVKNSITAY